MIKQGVKHSAAYTKSGSLSLPLGLLRAEDILITEAHCQYFYDTKTKRFAVLLVKEPKPQTEYRMVQRSSTIPDQSIQSGVHFSIKGVMASFGVSLTPGIVPLLEWNKDDRVLLFDLSPIIATASRASREVQARPTRALPAAAEVIG